MKKLLFIILAIGTLACTSGTKGYIIEGVISSDEPLEGKAYLSNFSSKEPIKDTVDLINGKFTFKGNVVTPERFYITVEGTKGRLEFFLDNSKYRIEADASDFINAKIIGGEEYNIYISTKNSVDSIQKANNIEALVNEFYAPETTDERKAEIREFSQIVNQEVESIVRNIFVKNPMTFNGLIYFSTNLETFSFQEMEEYMNKFNSNPKFANNRYLESAQTGVSALKNLQPGSVAPDFTLNDLDGNPVTLSEVYPKYKVTMIDFWAGWCGPCRRFNPYLVELYNKYKDHGFGIIGVSLDRDDTQWRDAIKEDNLTWIQVSDLQFWNAAPVKDYFVQSIPHNIFVDGEGRVIQRKVEKEEMDAFLAKLLMDKE